MNTSYQLTHFPKPPPVQQPVGAQPVPCKRCGAFNLVLRPQVIQCKYCGELYWAEVRG